MIFFGQSFSSQQVSCIALSLTELCCDDVVDRVGEGELDASDGGVSGLYSIGCVGSAADAIAGLLLLLLFWFGVEM